MNQKNHKCRIFKTLFCEKLLAEITSNGLERVTTFITRLFLLDLLFQIESKGN
uniref:Uncharacterized protein n=1 Tax=Lepeophtheirus salmonis TaxID=72036 RepID=A0A0K2UBX9_LEPSM